MSSTCSRCPRGSFTVTASAHGTLNQIYPGRVLFGIGRGESARRTIGMNPYPTGKFMEIVRNIQTLMRGGSVPIVDHAGRRDLRRTSFGPTNRSRR